MYEAEASELHGLGFAAFAVVLRLFSRCSHAVLVPAFFLVRLRAQACRYRGNPKMLEAKDKAKSSKPQRPKPGAILQIESDVISA